MSIFIGRKFNIGMGKESTRGTGVAATYWFPVMDFSVEDKISVVVDGSSRGIIEDATTEEITQKYSLATLGGRVTDQSFGLILMATMGTDTVGAVETGVKDHVFTILESAQHPSMTIVASEPNASGASSLSYALGMIESLEIDFAVGQWAQYKASFRANANAAASSTPSFITENAFNPQYCVAKFADTYGGLAAAAAVNVRSAKVVISKNVEDDQTIGNLAAVDRYNKQFQIEGEMVLVYNARTYIDTDMLADKVQAIRLIATNTGVTIGAASNPTLTIDLARCKITEVARTNKVNDVMLQTIKFKAFYSISDSIMTQITLRNVVAAAY